MRAQESVLDGPLTPAEFDRLARVSRRLPLRFTASPRRRRLLLLALAAPGFAAVFSTPMHQNLLVLVLGFAAVAAALLFRRRTERVFQRAEAAALWPPAPSFAPQPPEVPRV